MFLSFINYFRGFAILLIVIGHLFGTVKVFNYDNPYMNTIFTKSIFSLVSGGTSLFVFISGFLFHHVFYSRGFNFKKFLINKLKNVLCPYLILMTPVVVYQLLYVPRYQKLHTTTLEFFKYLFLSLYSGTMLLSTWYIPFAFLLFLSSPIFIKFIEMKKYHKTIMFVMLLLGSIVHRPAHDFTVNVFQALIYFSPVYCLGIYISMEKDSFFEKFENKSYIFGLITLGILAFQIYTGKFINSHKSILIYKGIDVVIFQKFFMCLYLVLFFNKYEKYFNKVCKKIFETLAEYSFPIFFLHNYIIQFLYPAIGFEKESGYIGLILLTILTLFLSIVFAYIVKKIFKKNSRYLIGG
ncbi:acyltransferase [uncultured Cetobacterium sp.]|uniref:acyltransferase family protein n=1 Tax=uncultured Cetobacterium sp. TaxID=527638 RepID=UPI0025D6666B|nr:acyltransferase [uncultured Cetobacterium sp.]